MQIGFEGFEKKEDGSILKVKLLVGIWQSLKIGLGLGLGLALATVIIILISLIFGVSIFSSIFKFGL